MHIRRDLEIAVVFYFIETHTQAAGSAILAVKARQLCKISNRSAMTRLQSQGWREGGRDGGRKGKVDTEIEGEMARNARFSH